MSDLIRINNYLAAEYGYFNEDGEVVQANDNYPFQIEYLGEITSALHGSLRLYVFGQKKDGLAYIGEKIVGSTGREGLSIECLQSIWAGQDWLESEKAAHHLFTVQAVYAIPETAAGRFSKFSQEIHSKRVALELKVAAYVPRLDTYVWLGTEGGEVVAGVRDAAVKVPFESRNDWRKLSYGVGEFIQHGTL